MNLYRQEKLVEKLLKFRLKKQGFSRVKVDRFNGDDTMCRVEVFQGGKSIKHRVMKYEAYLDEAYIVDLETCLNKILER